MTPNGAKAGMVRLVASFLALMSFVVPAVAGDRALIDFVGYSPDARYFAFEEFGISDGSGFAYSSLYIVDLVEDSWVVGTPIRLQADDEETELQQIRAEVRLKAADALETLDIVIPAELLALVGDGVPDADDQNLQFGTPSYAPGIVSDAAELHLSSFPTAASAPCEEWFGTKPTGYKLTITEQGEERVLHRDTTLPRSRGCPTAYRLYGVVLPFQSNSTAEAVGIISVYPGGFEGPDRRFIAVPLGN